jgi:hypothetical protein
MIRWLNEEVKQFCSQSLPFLLVLDQASFHRTTPILNWFQDNFITAAVILSGCTSLLQPLDTAVNKTFKVLLKKYTEAFTLSHPTLGNAEIQHWSASERRILTTKAVAEAWDELPRELVAKSFIDCGISIKLDGSEDLKVSIKDLPDVSWDGWDTEYINPSLKLEQEELLGLDPDKDRDLFDCEGRENSDSNSYSAESTYLNLRCKDLKVLLKARKLSRTGNKPDLVGRLMGDDQSARSRRCGGRSKHEAVVIHEDHPPQNLTSIPAVHQETGGDWVQNKENELSVDSQYYSQ